MRIWVVEVQGASCRCERTRSATRRQQGLALRCSGQCNMMARGQLHAHCSGRRCSPAWGLTLIHEGRRTQMQRQVVTLTHRVAALTRHVQVGADKDADAREDRAAAAGAARSDEGEPPLLNARSANQQQERRVCAWAEGAAGIVGRATHAMTERRTGRCGCAKGDRQAGAQRATGKRVAGARKGPEPLF